MNKKTLNFVKKAKEVHGNKYDYSLSVIQENWNEKVLINCNKHGQFMQRCVNHIQGNNGGCKECLIEQRKVSFVKKAKEVHGNKYDYSLVNYKKNNQKVKIICNEHGIFEQTPSNHLTGSGCPLHSGKSKLTTNSFVKKAKEVHGNKYDYSLVDYIMSKVKVKITCSKHGVFEQKPYHHLSGTGCPVCKESKGEKEIKRLLIINSIHNITQKKFDKCISENNRKLAFDFYLPDNNICIEYDGRQHFEPVSIFGGIKGFETTKKRDKIKDLFCEKNNINLIRIKYDENIEDRITELKLW